MPPAPLQFQSVASILSNARKVCAVVRIGVDFGAEERVSRFHPGRVRNSSPGDRRNGTQELTGQTVRGIEVDDPGSADGRDLPGVPTAVSNPGGARRIALLLESALPGRRGLREIRDSWGKPGAKDRWLDDRYFRLTQDGDASRYVDEKTWIDLEFPRLFGALDSTITRLGSQCLFKQLRTYANDASQREVSYGTFETLRRDVELRERIQRILMSLNADSAASLVDMLFEERIEGLPDRFRTVSWSLLSICVLAAAAASLIPPLLVLPVLVVNVVAIGRTSWRRYGLVEKFKGLYRMVRVSDALSRISTDSPVPQLAALAAGRASRTRVRRAFRWFNWFDRNSLGIGTWLHMMFLAEWLACLHVAAKMSAMRAELRTLYELVGSLDAAIAVASFLTRNEVHCRSSVAPAGTLDIESGYHPLLAAAVANSLRLSGRSALISGSNMAGKTTFIKMVAINAILGRTLGFCLAKRATLPNCPVRAAIRSDHSVESGKSKYFIEIESILSLLRDAACDCPELVVIDEPFSGTNTTERIAAAKAVLSALSRSSQVLATTHDVELQTLLRDRFEVYHFTESPEVAGFFDFRLRPGPCAEGNALRLLATVGYPAAVIEEALALVASRHGEGR